MLQGRKKIQIKVKIEMHSKTTCGINNSFNWCLDPENLCRFQKQWNRVMIGQIKLCSVTLALEIPASLPGGG